jgi:glycosyltransferase involved in cell wall biosynthesis
MSMKHIFVVSPCYNEEENLRTLYDQLKQVFSKFEGKYRFSLLFIDNCSTDSTPMVLRELAQADRNVKVIFNQGNFGHIRSPFYALLQSDGDAAILMASDLQDPPEMIVEFLKRWEDGNLVVQAVKTESEESAAMFAIRSAYYNFINRLSDIDLTKNTTGFGLYDRKVIELLKSVNDPYPYFRGLVSELGFKPSTVPFRQPKRKRGITSNNFYSLYDIAMLGITNHSKVPLRIATMLGFVMSAISFLVAMGYLIAKLVWWNQFVLGTAPMVIGLFFFISVLLFFLGIIGEYIGSIHTQVLKRPRVVERERINF